MHCFSCQKDVRLEEKVGFRDECAHCGADLHVCLNCRFYDAAAYNECREPQAERVVDKERANFCEYFQPGTSSGPPVRDAAADAKKKLAALFKKK